MKSIINSLLIICAAGLMFGACKKDQNKQVVSTTNAKTTLKASSSAIVLDSAASSAANNAVTFTWDSVSFGFRAQVTYSLQFDTTAAFTTPVTKSVGVNVLTQSYTVSDLNTMAINMGIQGFTAGNIQVRVVAKISDSVARVYSNPIVISVTPYVSTVEVPFAYLWVVGDYMSWTWPPSSGVNLADSLASVKSDGKYEGFVNIAGGTGTDQFKICKYYGWDGAFANANTGATIVTTGNITTQPMNTAGGTTNNFSVPANGYYFMQADTNTAISVLTATLVNTFSILGTATGGTAVPLTYNAAANDWSATGVSLSAGTFKFVINNGDVSSISFGAGSSAGKVGTAGSATPITVTTAGTFHVILNVSNPGRYVDTLQ